MITEFNLIYFMVKLFIIYWNVATIIDSAGFIHRVQVSQSSGTELLDTAAIEAVKRLGRYLPIPPELQRQQWSLEIPIEYSLL